MITDKQYNNIKNFNRDLLAYSKAVANDIKVEYVKNAISHNTMYKSETAFNEYCTIIEKLRIYTNQNIPKLNKPAFDSV